MEGLNNRTEFTQENSPDGALNHAVQGKDFLQSEEWQKFQESVGRKIYSVSNNKDVKSQSDYVPSFHASIIEHQLPMVGKYFYIPRGPIIPAKAEIQKSYLDSGSEAGMTNIINLAKENNIGWIRFDANSLEILGMIKNAVWADLVSAQKGQTQDLSLQNYKIVKSPHDMQPREILVMDITKSEEELLAEMKAKTRYNVRLAEKKGVTINVIPAQAGIQENLLDSGSPASPSQGGEAGMTNKYIDEFLRLVKITAKRDGITPHPENYYRKMFEVILNDILKLYIAEYQGKIIAANIMVFYGNTATYLHGASDYNYRDAMAPYLLQWQAILDAKKAGFTKYDLGGVKIPKPETQNLKPNWFKKITGYRLQVTGSSWQGITRFKTGFAPNTKLTIFPGSYDIVINPFKYKLYEILQATKNIITCTR